MSLVTIAYNNASDDVLVQNAVQTITAQHEKLVRDLGLYVDFKYLNYADISQDPIGSYGAKNNAALRLASKKYDPNGLFQKGVPGGYKLFT